MNKLVIFIGFTGMLANVEITIEFQTGKFFLNTLIKNSYFMLYAYYILKDYNQERNSSKIDKLNISKNKKQSFSSRIST